MSPRRTLLAPLCDTRTTEAVILAIIRSSVDTSQAKQFTTSYPMESKLTTYVCVDAAPQMYPRPGRIYPPHCVRVDTYPSTRSYTSLPPFGSFGTTESTQLLAHRRIGIGHDVRQMISEMGILNGIILHLHVALYIANDLIQLVLTRSCSETRTPTLAPPAPIPARCTDREPQYETREYEASAPPRRPREPSRASDPGRCFLPRMISPPIKVIYEGPWCPAAAPLARTAVLFQCRRKRSAVERL